MKALVPFFFFAAVRNRMWSQAAASALVWVVVTAYSLTSALGHAALNRFDSAGKRAATVETYNEHRADLARAKEQLSWIPQHRPAQAVQADIDGLTTSGLGPGPRSALTSAAAKAGRSARSTTAWRPSLLPRSNP